MSKGSSLLLTHDPSKALTQVFSYVLEFSVFEAGQPEKRVITCPQILPFVAEIHYHHEDIKWERRHTTLMFAIHPLYITLEE